MIGQISPTLAAMLPGLADPNLRVHSMAAPGRIESMLGMLARMRAVVEGSESRWDDGRWSSRMGYGTETVMHGRTPGEHTSLILRSDDFAIASGGNGQVASLTIRSSPIDRRNPLKANGADKPRAARQRTIDAIDAATTMLSIAAHPGNLLDDGALSSLRSKLDAILEHVSPRSHTPTTIIVAGGPHGRLGTARDTNISSLREPELLTESEHTALAGFAPPVFEIRDDAPTASRAQALTILPFTRYRTSELNPIERLRLLRTLPEMPQ